MFQLSNNAGYDGYGETSGSTGDSAEVAKRKALQKLIQQANSVSLVTIFKHYHIQANEHNRKIICPFKSHKGGRENTPSFWFYPDTNSYNCFGCHNGGHNIEFVAEIDNISKIKAAQKILNLFQESVSDDDLIIGNSLSEKLEIITNFSNLVREFRQYNFSDESENFIESICLVYDDLQNKHQDLSNEALRQIVDKLSAKINLY